jgi:hypothetical protein
MAGSPSAKELVQLMAIGEDETVIEQKRLCNGDFLIRNALGESLTLSNGMRILIRPGYFSLSVACEVTVERSRSGMTTLMFANGDELKFDNEGIQLLRREMIVFQFVRQRAFAPGQVDNIFNVAAPTPICIADDLHCAAG